MPGQTTSLRLTGSPLHLAVEPGTEIVLRGSFRSSFDGTVIDAATTTWPADAPGGASVDPAGLIDLEAGGFHLLSRDPVSHEVRAVATGEGGEACAALGSTAPCLPLRLSELGLARRPAGITAAELARSLQGGIQVEGLPPPVVAPAALPFLSLGAGAVALGLGALLLVRSARRRAASPSGQLLALARQVQDKLGRADGAVAAPLTPAVDAALTSLRRRRVHAESPEGERIKAALAQVNARLDAAHETERAGAEQRAADEILGDIDNALRAADELCELGMSATPR